MLLLAGVIAPPGLSAAQEGGSGAAAGTTAPAPLTPESPPTVDPVGEANESLKPGEDGGAAEPAVATAPPATATVAQSSGGKEAKASASASVSVGDNFYSPASVTVNVGDTVSWKNDGAAQHSATADDGSFDTGVFGPGSSRSHTFNSAGTFSYFCTVHGQAQSGTVRVQSASGGSGKGGGASVPGPTEADAVASAGAAGSSTSLPATGLAALGLGIVGLALLGSGAAIRRLEPEGRRRRRAPRLHSIF